MPRYLPEMVFLCAALTVSARLAHADAYQGAMTDWKNGQYAQALSALQTLGEAGDRRAQLRLGILFEKGVGVPREGRIRKSYDWYLSAANQGDAEAQNRVGDFYFDASFAADITQDLAIAERWHRRAAEQGHIKSRFKLGSLLCWQGHKEEGYAWLEAARLAGDKNAPNEIARVCQGLPEEARARAQGRAAQLAEQKPE
jgi:hypothetical protein